MIRECWVRTCQECGFEQITKELDLSNDKWRDLKCKKCKSEALDFGSTRKFDTVTMKWVKDEED